MFFINFKNLTSPIAIVHAVILLLVEIFFLIAGASWLVCYLWGLVWSWNIALGAFVWFWKIALCAFVIYVALPKSTGGKK